MKGEPCTNSRVNEVLINKEFPPIPKDRILKDRILTVKEVEKILKERQISIFEDENYE